MHTEIKCFTHSNAYFSCAAMIFHIGKNYGPAWKTQQLEIAVSILYPGPQMPSLQFQIQTVIFMFNININTHIVPMRHTYLNFLEIYLQ